MKKAVFLDRDGVINEDKGYVHKISDFKFLPNVPEAIRSLNEREYLVIVITNQSGIARGFYSEQDMHAVHNHMTSTLSNENARIDAIYFCPHLSDPKEIVAEKYLLDCECRKPKPGMILQAQRDFQITDISQCFLVGDKISDIQSGKTAGCKTVLVNSKYVEGIRETIPDYSSFDLYDAVHNTILNQH